MAGVHLSRAAAEDIREANKWYLDKGGAGLASLFRQAIDRGIARIEQNPFQFPIVHRSVRRVVLARFPYLLFFVIEDDGPFVIACLHASRNPAVWKRRG